MRSEAKEKEQDTTDEMDGTDEMDMMDVMGGMDGMDELDGMDIGASPSIRSTGSKQSKRSMWSIRSARSIRSKGTLPPCSPLPSPRRLAFLPALAFCLLALTARAADWPQYMGPHRTGVSPETGLARQWPEAGPPTLWRAQMAPGFSGPCVVDGTVYILDRRGADQDVIRAFDLRNGAGRGSFAWDAPGKLEYDGARGIPTADGDRLYVVGAFGHFLALNRTTLEPLWRRNLLDDFETERPEWGVTQSPTIHGDLVIVAPQSGQAAVAAYHKITGDLVWQSPPLPGFMSFGHVTPVVCTLAGVEQVVMITAVHLPAGSRPKIPGRVAGFSLSDGRLLWEYDGWQCKIPIAGPTPVGEDRLFVTGGYQAGSVMLRLTADGEGLTVEELWRAPEFGSPMRSAILHGDHLYGLSNCHGQQDGLMCMTLDGEILWRTRRSPNFERGDLILADGMFYIMEGARGTLHLVEPSPEGYRELAQSPALLEGKMNWGPLALSEGVLLARGQDALVALDVRAPAAVQP